MKTNILKAMIAVLPIIIAGCHSGTAQTTTTNGADSIASTVRDTMKGVNTPVRKDSGKILRDTSHRNRDTVKP